MQRTTTKQRSQGFTLVEILVVLAIIAILAAILFPAFGRAKEGARQTNCASNLQKIYYAVHQYYDDEKRYPASMAFLLPHVEGTKTLADYSTAGATVENKYGTGYLKVSDRSFVCPDDTEDEPNANAGLPRSSYGDISTGLSVGGPSKLEDPGRWVWNFWGYDTDGTAYADQAAAKAGAAASASTGSVLYDPNRGYSYPPDQGVPNPINYSMSNRFAPSSTVITHCFFHRPSRADLSAPAPLARDIILRLDGSAKPVDISQFTTNKNWQYQNNF